MRTIEELAMGLTCDDHGCEGCPYDSRRSGERSCESMIFEDTKKIILQLVFENENLKKQIADKDDSINTLLEVEHSDYWENICKLNARQEIKGKSKYGVSLEENTTLTRKQRIEHLEEELIDGLKYCEHLKAIDDDGITANDYQRAAMRTAGDDEENYLLNGVMGLCGESGEVIDLVKKHLYQGHEMDKKKLALECGDCAWYLALITSVIGMSFGEVLQMNIEKLKERYPDGFSKERSINRKEYQCEDK